TAFTSTSFGNPSAYSSSLFDDYTSSLSSGDDDTAFTSTSFGNPSAYSSPLFDDYTSSL
ncbi:unnamed protein product, partial [Scytosiphon promiscuus]